MRNFVMSIKDRPQSNKNTIWRGKEDNHITAVIFKSKIKDQNLKIIKLIYIGEVHYMDNTEGIRKEPVETKYQL